MLGGVGPGLLCIVLSAKGAGYFFLPPLYTFFMDTVGDAIALDVSILTGTGLCLLIGSWICTASVPGAYPAG